MEYIDDWKWFVRKMCEKAKSVIMSYCVTDRCPNAAVRRKVPWVNDLSREDIIAEFLKYDFQLIPLEENWLDNTAIFKFVQRDF